MLLHSTLVSSGSFKQKIFSLSNPNHIILSIPWECTIDPQDALRAFYAWHTVPIKNKNVTYVLAITERSILLFSHSVRYPAAQ